MQTLAKLAVAALAAGLGIAIAYRLSTESMAVVVGLICGLSALIPVVLVTLVLLRRATNPPASGQSLSQVPHVIVIQPGPAQTSPWTAGPYPPLVQPPEATQPRDFRIIGDDD
jgi:hypothetical protein